MDPVADINPTANICKSSIFINHVTNVNPGSNINRVTSVNPKANINPESNRNPKANLNPFTSTKSYSSPYLTYFIFTIFFFLCFKLPHSPLNSLSSISHF